MDCLPATAYQSPPRLGRGRQLNTITEDNEDVGYGPISESEGTASDDIVIRGPGAQDFKKYIAPSRANVYRPVQVQRRGPPSVVSSDCDDDNDEFLQPSSRNSYSGSESGTVFSESCPSLTGSHASDATTFATESNRSSIDSRHRRTLLPALIIPRNSWGSFLTDTKQMPMGMSPATKVRLSSQALDMLHRDTPAEDAPPSLADTGSIRSTSPCPHFAHSAPSTPDLHNIEVHDGQAWGQPTTHITLDTSLEIAIDEEHSIIFSAVEAHSIPQSASHMTSTARSSGNWNEIVRQFPAIPGATPIELTPITPDATRFQRIPSPTNESGVQLPEQAFEMLANLNRQSYIELADNHEFNEEEMRECAVPKTRPTSWDPKSAISENSMSQLSIPSPGGFFASLPTGTRHTWSAPRRASPPPPSSTTAENFYRAPWTQTNVQHNSVKETIVECADEGNGPPTMTQATFNLSLRSQEEDAELYTNGRTASPGSEYDQTYSDDVQQKAGENIGRTGDWLVNQNDFLTALRDADTVSDLTETSPISETTRIAESEELVARQNLEAVHFLAEATAAVSPTKESMFLAAFKHQKSETKRGDVFLHASSRLSTVQSSRITLPKRHVQALLNTCTSKTLNADHVRPKYRGPFSQNPRATGDFTCTVEQAVFSTLERQQNALHAIKPNLWTLEAQRAILYNGRLVANSSASERLTKMNNDIAELRTSNKPDKKRPRILDLAGAATASWAWAAATKWPNITVHTVQTEQQAELARNYPAAEFEDVESFRPETPTNHKVSSVPYLWQLPFRDNHFDVISARSLHMHLRAKPVPGVESIDEWNLTLKECMRVLKPGGTLDFFVMDSGICNDVPAANKAINLSPNLSSSSADSGNKPKNVAVEFKSELERRGYESDGGCRRLMGRLKQEGFVKVKRQWIGLPMGHSQAEPNAVGMHHRNTSTVSATSQLINQPQFDTSSRKQKFMAAPRPISEVSTISKIIDQYADVEAVQGPVGSTTGVADMTALLGELLWEEWLVRLRIEGGNHTPENILDGIEEQFGEWRRSGNAAWRGVIGWARKPSKSEPSKKAARAENTRVVSMTSSAPSVASTTILRHGFGIDTPLPTPDYLSATPQYTPVALKRRSAVRASRRMSGLAITGALAIDTNIASQNFGRALRTLNEDYGMSAWERGEVGDIPLVMMG